MLVTLLGIVTLVKLAHSLKASSPMLVTVASPSVLGMVSVVALPVYLVIVHFPLLMLYSYSDCTFSVTVTVLHSSRPSAVLPSGSHSETYSTTFAVPAGKVSVLPQLAQVKLSLIAMLPKADRSREACFFANV